MGWNWAVETASLGHQVVALTQTELRTEIDAELGFGGRLPPTLRFEFFMPPWLDGCNGRASRSASSSLTWHLVHLLWQILAYRHARRHLAELAFRPASTTSPSAASVIRP